MAFGERLNHVKECMPEHVTYILQHVKDLSSLVSNSLHLTSVNKTNGSLNPFEKKLEQSMRQIGAAMVETKTLKSRIDQQDSRIESLENATERGTLPVGFSVGLNNELQEMFRNVHNQEVKLADIEVFVVEVFINYIIF